MPEQPQHQDEPSDGLGCLIAPFVITWALLYALPAHAISRRRATRKLLNEMTLAGHTMSWDELNRAIQTRGGTLIVDSPYWGWSGTHVWWTPDDVQIMPDARPWVSHDTQPKSAATMNAFARFSQSTAARYFGPTSRSFLIHASCSNRQSKLANQNVAELRARHPNVKFASIASTMPDCFAEDDEAGLEH